MQKPLQTKPNAVRSCLNLRGEPGNPRGNLGINLGKPDKLPGGNLVKYLVKPGKIHGKSIVFDFIKKPGKV